MDSQIKFDSKLLNKYNQPLPRYTSYPPATELESGFAEVYFKRALAVGNYQKAPLSLYCHIPFCETACYFCGCNTVITKNSNIVELYLEYLLRHIQQMSQLVCKEREVIQIHIGGGTPNYLSEQQLSKIWQAIEQNFQISPEAEISLEVNPRNLNREYLFFLRKMGFNRISFGIQDFAPQVQEAVNRIQDEAMLFKAMEWIREAGFSSVNIDLIYGLPYQSLETFKNTITKTKQLNPDRIAIFNFAYIPWLKPLQKRILPETLPSSAEKLAILEISIEQLSEYGYQFIGMDHFAKPDDELAIAQNQGRLHRNFQGYTTKPESDLLGFGISSISMLHDVYVQNHKKLKDFYQDLDSGLLPIEKGVNLDHNDVVRRSIIMELMCQFRINWQDLQSKYGLKFEQGFAEYFAKEQAQLKHLKADGLIEIYADGIEVTPKGRLLIRNIASVFDSYLQEKIIANFSQAI
jgi:oxygen-independent coproporphyrinogen III oxidase